MAREMRDAQIAAKLRQSVSDLQPDIKKERIKREHTPPDSKMLEPVSREPEYSRKERLQEARETNIVVKVENVQHSYSERELRDIAEKRHVEQNHESPNKRRSHERMSQPRDTRDMGKHFVNSNSDRMQYDIKNIQDLPLPPGPASPGYESASDLEPSPAPVPR